MQAGIQQVPAKTEVPIWQRADRVSMRQEEQPQKDFKDLQMVDAAPVKEMVHDGLSSVFSKIDGPKIEQPVEVDGHSSIAQHSQMKALRDDLVTIQIMINSQEKFSELLINQDRQVYQLYQHVKGKLDKLRNGLKFNLYYCNKRIDQQQTYKEAFSGKKEVKVYLQTIDIDISTLLRSNSEESLQVSRR